MRCHSNFQKINISSRIYLSICHCHQSLIIIWDIFCPLHFPQTGEQSSPCRLQVHLAVWQPVLQSHLKTWMSFSGTGKRSVCIATMLPSTIIIQSLNILMQITKFKGKEDKSNLFNDFFLSHHNPNFLKLDFLMTVLLSSKMVLL